MAFAVGSASAIQTVPASGSWRGWTASLSGDRKHWALVSPDGSERGILHGDPWGTDVSAVIVGTDGDRLAIDATEYLAAGADRKLTLTGLRLDAAALGGGDATMKADVEGPQGCVCALFFEGQSEESKHYYEYLNVRPRGRRRDVTMVKWVPEKLRDLHVRFDIERLPERGPVLLGTFRAGTVSELPPADEKKIVKSELVFALPFDGSAVATVGGTPGPLDARNLRFAPGRKGQALRVGSSLGSRLAYAIDGNLVRDRGTVALWVKREWDFSKTAFPWQSLFAFEHPNGGRDRIGSGALWFWWYNGQLRGDVSDADDNYRTFFPPLDDRWTHVAFSWDEDGVVLHVNGRRCGLVDDGASPMVEALRSADRAAIDRSAFDRFFVGNRSGFETFNGLIDDFRIYSAPLSDAEVKALWRELARPEDAVPPPDYAAMAAKGDANRYVRPPVATPGVPGKMTLVDEVRLDSVPADASRFASTGPTAVRDLDGTRYLEAGPGEGDRFAVRFTLDPDHPLYCFEFDYPDDGVRTVDITVQPSKGWSYAMEVGYATGAEYPLSRRIRTHRCVYWTPGADVTAIAMTARAGQPAALSAIRVYRIEADGLPETAINEPEAVGGWHRTVSLYFEDPSVSQECGLSDSWTQTPEGQLAVADRVIAGMKYTGQNLLAYPGAWYHGLIGEDYNPRSHAPDFLSAYYEKFDRAGLGLMPTLNVNNMPVPRGLVTRATMSNGTLHPSPIAIHDTGRPNWGKWHDTPPNFNFLHPDVQAYIAKMIDTLVAQGRGHPSFKGICLHLTKHCLLWWGDERSGYNDYAVEAFAREKGLRIPIDGTRPLRGLDYAKWLRANAWEDWIQWRCDRVTAFYARLAAKLASARPDLKLWINSFVPADVNHPDFMRPDYMSRANRACGLDAAALTRSIPNLILCQSIIPADFRHLPANAYPSAAARERQRDLDLQTGTYDLIAAAAYPWVNQHDRYWESAIGGKGALNTPWLTEMGWRVTTINPSGRSALRHFVAPLRHTDVLGLSKGGFLIGTYGMEDVLVPFVQAFRALPAVRMTDVPNGPGGDVRFRHATVGGCDYFYLVNTGEAEQTVCVDFPSGLRNLVTGDPVVSGKVTLQPYELRSYGGWSHPEK